jgi:hypothetical protein
MDEVTYAGLELDGDSGVRVKAIQATIEPVDSEHPDGEFKLLLSTDNLDRDDENLWADEWMDPLPDRVHFDTDHAFKKGLSVPYTAGSGVPELTENGEILVKGVYAGTPHGQLTRKLVNGKHIWQASVSYQERVLDDGRVVREILNGTFTGVPANPKAVVLSSKSVDADGDSDQQEDSMAVNSKTAAPLTAGSRHADPGYLDRKGQPAKSGNGVPRYQIDDAPHVRNALARFSQNAGDASYTASQRSAILGRIRSAARRLGVDVSDSDEKTLAWALCKAVTFKDASQTMPGHTPTGEDLGASSVYDEDGEGQDEDEDDEDAADEAGAPGGLTQALHDAAVSLGASCASEESAITKSAEGAAIVVPVRPAVQGFDGYSITVAGPPGSEMYTLRHKDTVVGHGQLESLTAKPDGETEEAAGVTAAVAVTAAGGDGGAEAPPTGAPAAPAKDATKDVAKDAAAVTPGDVAARAARLRRFRFDTGITENEAAS